MLFFVILTERLIDFHTFKQIDEFISQMKIKNITIWTNVTTLKSTSKYVQKKTLQKRPSTSLNFAYQKVKLMCDIVNVKLQWCYNLIERRRTNRTNLLLIFSFLLKTPIKTIHICFAILRYFFFFFSKKHIIPTSNRYKMSWFVFNVCLCVLFHDCPQLLFQNT